MKLTKPFLVLALLAAISLSACSGVPKGPCTTNCGGGGGTTAVSLVVTSDNPPSSPSIISFTTSISGIVLKNASSGATANLSLSNTQNLDLVRLQSDSAFLGVTSSVTSGTYDTATIALTSSNITFFNNTGVTITGTTSACTPNAICQLNPTAAGNPTITLASPVTLGTTGAGLALDLNLTNAVTVSGSTLAVNFNATSPALSMTALPRTSPNLASNQLDLIEDFTGVVSVSGQNVTITSPTRGTLTAVATTSGSSPTIYLPGPDPAHPICSSLTFTCVQVNEVASIDAALNNDGTLSLLSYEPFYSTPQDLIEGMVVSVVDSTHFQMVVADKTLSASGSTITASPNLGDLVSINLPNTVSSFLVDTKGLAVDPGILNLFANFTNTAPIKLGQTVSVKVQSFTAATGNTPASANAAALTLRFSRFTTSAVSPLQSTAFNIANFPAYFTATGTKGVQAYIGSAGSQVGTNYDGINDPTGLTTGGNVAIRALYIDNTSNAATNAFFAAKVRKPLHP